MFEFANEPGPGEYVYRGIKKEGVVDILLKMGLLERSEGAQRNGGASAIDPPRE